MGPARPSCNREFVLRPVGPPFGLPPYRQLFAILAVAGVAAKHGGKRVRNSPQWPHSLPNSRASGALSDSQLKEVAMRSIWMSRLGRASTILAITGLAIAATGVGAAEARDYGYYYDGWGYRQYYSRPAWSHQYYYRYAPALTYSSPPA